MASNVFRSVLKLALIVILFYSMALLPSISGRGKQQQQQIRMALGSRPPRCVGKCMGCRPCVAALVIPPHHKWRWWWFRRTSTSGGGGHGGEDENYYPLSWKCRCRNKYFQP